MKHYPTRDALAAAVYAAEESDGTVVRTQFVKNNKIYKPNREILLYQLENGLPAITDLHFATADKILPALNHSILMKTLKKGGVKEYVAQTKELLEQETISARQIGHICWAPHMYAKQVEENRAAELLSTYGPGSIYVGFMNKNIETEFNLISYRYLRDLSRYAVLGHNTAGDLIQYSAKNKEQVITKGLIKGRVYKHETNKYYNGYRVTCLNYVKELKDD